MATLVPDDFDIASLAHSEQRVVRAFLDGCDDTWYLLPSVRILDKGNDREIDLLIVSASYGALAIEVKGGVVAIEDGVWRSYDTKIKNPLDQALKAKHALIAWMRSTTRDSLGVFVAHAASLPDVVVPAAGLGPDAPRGALIDKLDLDDPGRAVTRFLPEKPVPAARVEKFIRAVRPSITLTVEDGRYHDAAKAAMDASTRERLGQARSMDVNSRVLVEGGAGSGKSWLIVDWARRAVQRGERTAVVCFNRPMADRLASMLRDTEAVVDTYHGLGMGLLEPFGFAAPENPGPDWWRKAVTKELRKRALDIGTPFDTIIVDEAQDLRPKWLDSLRKLLEPSGPNRLLMAMDPAQAIYVDKWSDSSEFFRSTLDVNLRSSRQIGELCQRLGGPAHLQDNPAGAPPSALRATGAKELAKRVRTAVEQFLEQEVPATEIAVLTTNRAERDGLITSLGSDVSLARWEDRDVGTVLCETIHRTKGLEWTAVVIATLDDPVDEQLLYVGASRPRMELILVGRDNLAGLLSR